MINITDYMNPISFFIAFCIGIFVVYVSTPTPTIIFKYPNPVNADKNIYKDNAGICYSYVPTEVNCADYKGKIVETEIQHSGEEEKERKKTLIERIKDKFVSK